MNRVKQYFHNLPIKHKLIVLSALSGGISVLLACSILLVKEITNIRQNLILDLSVTAEIVGANSSAALMFGDQDVAAEILSSLQAQPQIKQAFIFNQAGDIFCQYTQKGVPKAAQISPPEAWKNGPEFSEHHLNYAIPIVLDGETIGTLFIVSDLQKLNAALLELSLVTLISVLLAVLIGILIASRLQRLISRPIADLASAAQKVRDEDDYSVRAKMDTRDELGQLVDGFNSMLDRIEVINQEISQSNLELQQEIKDRKEAETQLKATHKQLLETSRLAGMAEVATGMLHNVGNTLTSVNVSATIIADKLRSSGTQHLVKLNSLIQEHATDLATFFKEDPKGEKIPAFLDNLTQVLQKEQNLYKDEIESLRKNVNHIRDIIETQQNYSKVVGVKELVRSTNLMDNALFLNEASILRHDVRVNKDYDFHETIIVERHKVLQILVNLVRNAIQATRRNKAHDREIVLYVQRHGDRIIEFQVTDNGVGIAKKNLKRIFQHGFTTKKTGHGFGLHSSALFAKEMGGQLSAYSDGLGKGASFVLQVPLETVESGLTADRSEGA